LPIPDESCQRAVKTSGLRSFFDRFDQVQFLDSGPGKQALALREKQLAPSSARMRSARSLAPLPHGKNGFTPGQAPPRRIARSKGLSDAGADRVAALRWAFGRTPV
jgi:hypothetical protein